MWKMMGLLEGNWTETPAALEIPTRCYAVVLSVIILSCLLNLQ